MLNNWVECPVSLLERDDCEGGHDHRHDDDHAPECDLGACLGHGDREVPTLGVACAGMAYADVLP